MKRCPACGRCRHYRLNDGRLKCRACAHRFSWTSVWDSVRLPTAAKQQLLTLFVLGVPSYRQRFLSATSAVSRERFYRLLRACCAQVEHLREPFEGAVELDETTFGGARKGKRGWGAAGKVIVFGLIKRLGITFSCCRTGGSRTAAHQLDDRGEKPRQPRCLRPPAMPPGCAADYVDSRPAHAGPELTGSRPPRRHPNPQPASAHPRPGRA